MIHCPAHREQASSRLRYSADRSQVSARFAFVVWPEEFLRGSDEKHAFDWDNSRSPSSAAIRCAPAFIVKFSSVQRYASLLWYRDPEHLRARQHDIGGAGVMRACRASSRSLRGRRSSLRRILHCWCRWSQTSR
jgi:hypothetical protein